MPPGRFDAVFVDFYGTLSAGDRLAVLTACTRVVESFDLELTPQQFAIRWGEQFFRIIDASNGDRFRTLHECEGVSLQATLRDMVGEIDPEPFVGILKAYWSKPQLHDDARQWLGRLHLPVCCVSNADTEDLESAIAMYDLRFDAVVTSEAARSYKPDPHIFESALEAMGVDPRRVMHVGDSLHSDVGGAGALGITTAWICRDDRIHDIGQARPDYTIRTLGEIPALLDGRVCRRAPRR